MFRSSNPTLNENYYVQERSYSAEDAMTVQGTVNKSFMLLFLIVLSAFWVWGQILQPAALPQFGQEAATVNPAAMGYVVFGAIAGLIVGLVTIFKRQWAKFTAPVYALLQGLFLGGISAVLEAQYPGIAVQAVALTFGVAFTMFGVYKSGLIKVDQKFIMGVASATGAIMLVYIVNIVLGFFGRGVPFVMGSGPIGIGFSVLVCGIAAFNLIVDFFMIERFAQIGSKKHMEWYAAFSLMVTLVWLYLEILRLLMKLNNRR